MSGWNTAKRDPADDAFSKYVRTVAKWQCRRCGRHAEGRGFHCAHFHGRRKESVRFDLENVDALCANCHKFFTEHYTEHKKWKLEQLGQQKYDLLALRASMKGEKNREMEKIYWRNKLKGLT